jgi:hypothetical protein
VDSNHRPAGYESAGRLLETPANRGFPSTGFWAATLRRPCGVVAFAFPAGSQADHNTGHYSHFWSSCQSTEPSRADPIGAIYWGANAPGYDHNLYNQANHVHHHAGWWGTSQSMQYFPNHGQCIEQDGGQETGGSSRYHQRIRRNLDFTVGLEYVTIATPHYEVTIHCGHAVTRNSTHPSGWSGYDIAPKLSQTRSSIKTSTGCTSRGGEILKARPNAILRGLPLATGMCGSSTFLVGTIESG